MDSTGPANRVGRLGWLAFAAVAPHLLAPGAHAASPCPAPVGDWTVVAYRLDDVSAVTDSQARVHLGKDLVLSAGTVKFGGKTCEILKAKRRAVSSDDTALTTALTGYATSVEYACRHGVVMPVVYISRRCDAMMASLDGANYQLAKK